MSKIFRAVSEARTVDTEIPRLCVVGAGPALTRVARALSAGAADERGGMSAAIDALTPAAFPEDEGLAGSWDIVVLVAAGCARRGHGAHRPRGARRRAPGHRSRACSLR